MITKPYLFFMRYKFIQNFFIFIYKIRGSKPWSLGYIEYKWGKIEAVLKSKKLLQSFIDKKLPSYFGVGIDERIVEYGWIFSNIQTEKKSIMLDAGSVFNFAKIINSGFLKNKELSIFTYYPELENFNNKRVSYIYGDLRNMLFKDEYFDEIICQSTIEHVDMDNSMYGYKIDNSSENNNKSYEYIKVIEELYRVLKKDGALLLTFPFGRFENHGFFQQFDSEMLNRVKEFFKDKGEVEVDFFKYLKKGWDFCEEDSCKDVVSYNPHTGKGKGNDNAAHCRSICCIKFSKK